MKLSVLIERLIEIDETLWGKDIEVFIDPDPPGDILQGIATVEFFENTKEVHICAVKENRDAGYNQ